MLTLPIRQEWLDKIQQGEKLEEYREMKPYWKARLEKYLVPADAGKLSEYGLEHPARLRAGYRKDSPSCLITFWLDMGEGIAQWGAERGKRYYRLHIVSVKAESEDAA